MNKILKIILVAMSIVGLAACANNEQRLPEKENSSTPSILVNTYLMSVGDQLTINVWKNPELSISEPIRPDGKISLPLIGDVMAVGLGPEALARNIENKLKDYINAPNVTIILTNIQGQDFLSRIRVTGSVAHNMSMNYQQGMTVLDAILQAGSVDIYADANNTKLHRRTAEGSESYDIRLEDIMKNGDMSSNVLLRPGDVITVPESNF